MKSLLLWSIKIFWGMIGLECAFSLFAFLGHAFFASKTPDWETWFSCLPMAFLFVVLIWIACRAMYQLSWDMLGPTVFLVTLGLFIEAIYGQTRFFRPLIENREHTSPGLFWPLLDLTVTLVVIVGAFAYYRATLSTLRKMLFPHSVDVEPMALSRSPR